MLLGNRKEDWVCVCVPELVWATQSRGPRKMLAKVLFRSTWHNTLNDSTVCPWAVVVEGAFNGATRELPVLWHLQISHVEDAWGSSSHKEACMPTMLCIATVSQRTYPEVKFNPESSDFPDGGCQRLKVELGNAYEKKAKISGEINYYWVNAGNA